MEQIVVFKAWEGWGDRLQVLSHLLSYCRKHDARLCVDWRDKMWGHGKLDWKDFFWLDGVKTATIEEVEKIQGAIIKPDGLTMEMVMRPYTEWEQRDEFIAEIMRESREKGAGDIIVTNGSGWRKYDGYYIARHLRMTDKTTLGIIDRLKHMKLPATVVHLRGTDRYDDGNLKEWLKKYEALMPHQKERVYHATDDSALAAKWVKKVPHSKPLNPLSTALKLPSSRNRGLHQLNEEALNYYGISKYDLIIDGLAEFMGMAFASDAIGLEKSTFFTMARSIASLQTDGVALIMNGWSPKHLSLKPLLSQNAKS